MSTDRPTWRIVGPADRRVVPWANGLGTTAVIARVPDDEDWMWRLSLADVVADGPFSVLPGIDRWIAVARGGRMALTLGAPDGGESTVLDHTGGVVRFSGDGETHCRVLDGPLVDVNLMVRRGRANGDLDVQELGADERCTTEATAVVVLSGCVVLDDGTRLDEFDAVISSGSSAPDAPGMASVAVRSVGAARLAVVRIGPVPTS